MECDVSGTLSWLRGGSDACGGEDLPKAKLGPPEERAPPWEGRLAMPSERSVHLTAPPAACRAVLRAAVADVAAFPATEAVVQGWCLRATLFVDYVPIGFEATIYSKQAEGDCTVITLQHTTCNDVVRFAFMTMLLGKSLRARGLPVVGVGVGDTIKPLSLLDLGKGAFDPFDIDENELFSDDEEEEEGGEEHVAGTALGTAAGHGHVWRTAVETTLEAALSPSSSATARQEAAQALAWWAERRASCRPALALAFCSNERRAAVGAALQQAPVVERYPLAAALRRCCEGGGGNAAGCNVGLRALLDFRMEGLPAPAAHELTLAAVALGCSPQKATA